MKRHVFHGTSKRYEADIKEHGLPAIPPEAIDAGAEVRRSLGVRVRLDRDNARRDARAWTAALILEAFEGLISGHSNVAAGGRPEGIIVSAFIDDARLTRPRGTTLRVPKLYAKEIKIETVKFPEFGGILIGERIVNSASLEDARAAIERALDDFERLTDPHETVPYHARRRG